MRHVGSRKVHWLGFTSMDYIKHYSPYMCDSSTWETAPRYGSFSLYLGGGKSVQVNRKDFSKRPPIKIQKAIKKLGIDPLVLANESSWRGGESVSRTLSALSAYAMSVDVKKHTGTHLFSAAATELAVNLLIRARNRLKDKLC